MQQSIFSPTYFINYWVDQIQNTKLDSLEYLVNDKEFQKIAKKGIETQTKFIKDNMQLFDEYLSYSKSILKF
jgi:hypothetical protein